MQASIVDLRYHMKEVLNALDRNEEITVLYRGKKKAIIIPVDKQQATGVENHPFFGMYKDDKESVASVIRKLRKERYSDL